MSISTGRYSMNCLACGSPNLATEWSATSAFFARRALQCAPGVVPLLHCRTCGTRYYDIAISNADLARLYAGYRGEEYFQQRHALDPKYTRAVNDDLGGETGMQARRAALRELLAQSHVPEQFNAVLDHGGDRGQMLLELSATAKAVYEISGAAPEPGVVAIDEPGLKTGHWDLILSCHVLEHLPDPAACVATLAALGHAGTTYFFEIPDDQFRGFAFNRSAIQKSWINLVLKSPWLFQFMSYVSGGVRRRSRTIPPLLFTTLQEHLTYFSMAGATRLLERHGLRVIAAKTLPTGHIGIVAVNDARI